MFPCSLLLLLENVHVYACGTVKWGQNNVPHHCPKSKKTLWKAKRGIFSEWFTKQKWHRISFILSVHLRVSECCLPPRKAHTHTHTQESLQFFISLIVADRFGPITYRNWTWIRCSLASEYSLQVCFFPKFFLASTTAILVLSVLFGYCVCLSLFACAWPECCVDVGFFLASVPNKNTHGRNILVKQEEVKDPKSSSSTLSVESMFFQQQYWRPTFFLSCRLDNFGTKQQQNFWIVSPTKVNA